MNTKLLIASMALIIVSLTGYIALQRTGPDRPPADLAGHDEAEHGAEAAVEGEAAVEDEGVIELTAEAIREIGLETAVAGPGLLDRTIRLPGEIGLNRDRMARVAPRVEGVVAEVRRNLGDRVAAGETLAVIESRELADARAEYLAAAAGRQLAQAAFEREEKLWQEKISAEQEYLERKQTLSAAAIALRTARQKLAAIGFDEAELADLAGEPDRSLTRFEIVAPFAGTVIGKQLVLGELVGTGTAVYTIADLSTVWVELQVYPGELQQVRPGQSVDVRADSAGLAAAGTIDYVGPLTETESRTAPARVVLANEAGAWRPGLFVTGWVAVGQIEAPVAIDREAIQTLEGRKCVFVRDEHGFEPVFVEVGLTTAARAQIVSGLAAGQVYVTRGAFALKSKLITSTLGSHAGHGH